MATYYVRPDGSNSNAGTESNNRILLGLLMIAFKKAQVNILKVDR